MKPFPFLPIFCGRKFLCWQEIWFVITFPQKWLVTNRRWGKISHYKNTPFHKLKKGDRIRIPPSCTPQWVNRSGHWASTAVNITNRQYRHYNASCRKNTIPLMVLPEGSNLNLTKPLASVAKWLEKQKTEAQVQVHHGYATSKIRDRGKLCRSNKLGCLSWSHKKKKGVVSDPED